MFGLASTTHGELSGTIHAIDGMRFIRSGECRMTYNTTMNNAKHDNRVNRVQQDDLQHYNDKHNNDKDKNGKHNNDKDKNGKHNNGKHNIDKENNGKHNNGKLNYGKHNNKQWQGQKCSHSGESD
jgi:hypothetical protein